MPARTAAGRSACDLCAAIATFTIDAIKAAGTPCPETSATSTPRRFAPTSRKS